MGVLIAVVGLAAGWLLCHLLLARRVRRAEAQRAGTEAEAERALARLRRELAEADARLREQAEALQLVPDALTQLLATRGQRAVTPTALHLMQQLFQPRQAAVFVLRGGVLSLTEAEGLPAGFARGFEVRVGEGRVGFVADSRVPMDDSDFRNLSGASRHQVDEADSADLRVEVAAPMLDEDANVWGVLAIRGARVRRGQEKRLLGILGNLMGLAMAYKSHLRQAQENAEIDGLTRILNKRAFQQRLGEEILRAQREHWPLSLLLLDIDHFKHYNDTNGHLEGDDVLRGVGALLRASVREDDVAARYGGEEFVVLYPQVTKPRAVELADTLRRTVAAHPFLCRERQPGGALTLSGGVATYPADGQSGVDLLRAADQALYEAKGNGRNRIVAASPRYLT